VYTRAATQTVAPGLASLLRWASGLPRALRLQLPLPSPGPPRALWLQLPLPSPGQLRGHHVSCSPSSRCPARGRSGAATVPWRPDGRRTIKVINIP
jgi:hypothetical protein